MCIRDRYNISSGLEYIGADNMGQVPKGRSTTFSSGRAFDVIGNRKVLNYDRQRKKNDTSAAFLIMPGRIGTAYEFFDLLNLASLGLITKKIIVYNKNDCWTDLLTWIDKAKNMEMLRTIPKNLVIAENIDELIFALKSYV